VGDHPKEVRSYNMSQIRSKNTKPEELVRKALFAAGFRYRKNDKRLPGHPDIVLPKYKTVIFVNGCFWHKHEGCKYFVWPKSNTEYWHRKINGNVERDKLICTSLKNLDWNIIVIWECELKPNHRKETIEKLVKCIMGCIPVIGS
jgi:DNA mismatch endonuclease (patch repair protein)